MMRSSQALKSSSASSICLKQTSQPSKTVKSRQKPSKDRQKPSKSQGHTNYRQKLSKAVKNRQKHHQLLKPSHNWSNAGAQRNDVLLLTIASAVELDFTLQTSVTALTLKSVKTCARKKMCWKMTRIALPMTLSRELQYLYNHTNVE